MSDEARGGGGDVPEGAAESGGGGGSERRRLADRIHRLAIRMLRRLRREDEALGVSAARLSVLSVLVFGGPRRLGELARAEGVRAPTMSRMVAVLEEEGWARRRRDPRDGRGVVVEATGAGRELLMRGRARRLEWLEGALGALEVEEREVLEGALGLLEERLLGGRPEAG